MDEKLKQIRTKKMGVLIMDARQVCGRTPEECAGYMGVDVGTFNAFERGEQAPSLPQIELLAYYLQVPPEHFWGDEMLPEKFTPAEDLDVERLLVLRQKIVGAQLRQARIDTGTTLEEVAQKVGLSADQLKDYELGKAAVEVPVLEALSEAFGRPVKEFQDRHGPVGAWLTRENSSAALQHLSPELQAFIAKPINRPYLDLALRLSEMSVDKLRSVAEGLLEITF